MNWICDVAPETGDHVLLVLCEVPFDEDHFQHGERPPDEGNVLKIILHQTFSILLKQSHNIGKQDCPKDHTI